MGEQYSVDQALFGDELGASRERLAATQKILDVISQSRDDEQPVFEAILKSATQLCDVPDVVLMLLDEARETIHIAAHRGEKSFPTDPGRTWDLDAPLPVAQSFREARTIHVEDMQASAAYRDGHPTYRHMVDVKGLRTRLSVPLLLDGKAFGAIVLSRFKLQPFTGDEIALIETFAAQAVIAIENTRQFREVQTRLERERASAEILEVISQSRDNETPVFDAVLRNARRLCNASTAALMLGRPEDQHLTLAAVSHLDPAKAADVDERLERVNALRMSMDPSVHLSAKAICDGAVVHVPDMTETRSYRDGETSFRIMVDEHGQRSTLSVPLFDAQGALGAINLHRENPGYFSEDEIALVETFAAQAVIAIENVRQFRDLQTRLERERASAEILEVISRSREDEGPVFKSIVESAQRLCNAPMADLLLINEAHTEWHFAAHAGPQLRAVQLGDRPDVDRDLAPYRSLFNAEVIQEPDLRETDHYKSGETTAVAIVDEEGVRSRMCVPLISRSEGIGVLLLSRPAPGLFLPEDIALAEVFAAQAVIAIENTRQFRALEILNAELGERVKTQVSELERMGRLKRFLPAAVADAVVSSGSEKMLKSHRALLGVLFCDIRGFTAFCETAEPEETIEVLQTYHEEMGKLINAHRAGVDHRMGDGIMVLFNDPLPCDDPAGHAVRLAIAMRARMSELCRTWKRMGYRLGFGVGISLGYATVGMVGFEGRFDYTASGTAINLASRLCDEAEDGEILLSARAGIAVEDDFEVQSRGELNLKGLREPMDVFRLAGGNDA